MYQIGDKVLMTGRGASNVVEVVRITPKGFTVVRVFGTKYTYIFKPDGWERTSDKRFPRRIEPLTDEDVRLLEMKKIRKQTRDAFE